MIEGHVKKDSSIYQKFGIHSSAISRKKGFRGPVKKEAN